MIRRLLLCALCALLCCTAGPLPTAASANEAADIATRQQHAFVALLERFERNAEQAQAALQSTAADFAPEDKPKLSRLRAMLAADRDKADALATKGSLELSIIRAQISALGPAPGDKETEPRSITIQREALDARLGKAMAPVLRLREAQARASVLIAELDQRQKDISSDRLFSLDTSPLDPRQWVRAAGEVSAAAAAAGKRVDNFNARGDGTILGVELGALALFAFGPALATLGWTWLVRRIERRRERTRSTAGKLGLTLLLDASAGLVFAMALAVGVLAVILALLPFSEPEMLTRLAPALVSAGILVAIGRWLGRGVLLSPFRELRLLPLPDHRATAAFRTVQYLAIDLAGIAVLDSLEQHDVVGRNGAHLLSAVLVSIGGWLLWRLAERLREAHEDAEKALAAVITADTDTQTDAEQHHLDFVTPLSRLLKLFAVAGILAALAGFAILARFIFSATLLSLALVGIAVYIHRSIDLVIGMMAKGRLHRYRRVLHFVPLVAGFILTLLVVPLLAVIWGYSAAEIGDAILLLRNGVDFGEVRLSLGDVITFAAVFFAGFLITRWLQRFLKVTVLPEFAMDAGAEAALLTFLGYVGITLAALIAIATTGLDLSSLAFVAGALSIGLGFGLQSVVENFTSGILLLLERPIKVGDWIEVGENSGIVRKIAVRSTHIETFDRHQIIIPNSQLIAGVVKNRSFTTGPARIVVPVGVAYGSDLDRVSEVMLEIAHDTEGVLDFPAPTVAMESFGDSAVNLKILAFVATATDGAPTASKIMFAIARRFAEEGIEIPFPQRDLHLRTVPDGLAASPGGGDAAPA